jgi:hypothetical protein
MATVECCAARHATAGADASMTSAVFAQLPKIIRIVDDAVVGPVTTASAFLLVDGANGISGRHAHPNYLSYAKRAIYLFAEHVNRPRTSSVTCASDPVLRR